MTPNIDLSQSDFIEAIAEKVADRMYDENLMENIKRRLDKKVDALFAERAEATIKEVINTAINDGLDRAYQRSDSFGVKQGEPTTIRKELVKLIDTYWTQQVNPRSGEPSKSAYDNSVSRAEYVLTMICAQDFTKTMKDASLAMAGHLKDGLRTQLAIKMDEMLDSLFKVKSLQDQGKVEKPY